MSDHDSRGQESPDRPTAETTNQRLLADGGSLDWPAEFERTPERKRTSYPHGFNVTRSEAFDSILEELRKMDARNVSIETAAPHTAKNPHRPYAGRDPDDPGVVIYFERDGQQFAVPCDRWNNLRDNARAIALYLDAKRALERYGVQTIESEFTTQALPSADDAIVAEEPPHEILGVAADAPDEVVEAAARRLSANVHPDKPDGDEKQFKRIQKAKEAMLGE